MKKIGVALSGCGVYDGSEIHEATLTLYFLDRDGVEVICMAPDIDQSDVIDHLTRKPADEKRNIMVESARIARGDIKNIKDIKTSDIDALIFPGGLGASTNFCNFTTKGKDCTANLEIEKLIKEMHAAKKPLGFMCIAPVLAARVLGSYHPQLTIGSAPGTAKAIEEMGGKHIICAVDEIIIDKENKVVSTPAYMLGHTISRIALGIEKLVNKILELS